MLGDMYLRNLMFCAKGSTRWLLKVSSILDFDSKILLHRHKTCGESTPGHLLMVFPQKAKYIQGQFQKYVVMSDYNPRVLVFLCYSDNNFAARNHWTM